MELYSLQFNVFEAIPFINISMLPYMLFQVVWAAWQFIYQTSCRI